MSPKTICWMRRLRVGRRFGFLTAKLGGCASRSTTGKGWRRVFGTELSKGLFKPINECGDWRVSRTQEWMSQGL